MRIRGSKIKSVDRVATLEKGKSEFKGNSRATRIVEEERGFPTKVQGDPDLCKKGQAAPCRGEAKGTKEKEFVLSDREFTQRDPGTLCTHPESGLGRMHYGWSGRGGYIAGDIEQAATKANRP